MLSLHIGTSMHSRAQLLLPEWCTMLNAECSNRKDAGSWTRSLGEALLHVCCAK